MNDRVRDGPRIAQLEYIYESLVNDMNMVYRSREDLDTYHM